VGPREIKAVRERLKLSQVDLARLIGVEARSVHRWESGKAEAGTTPCMLLAAFRDLLDDERRGETAAKLAKRFGEAGGLYSLLIYLIERESEDDDG
jgi:DNA-binding XRE family transcriptional regulator